MASIAGSLYLDIREGRKITFGGNPETFLKIEKVDYKNNAFEVYTQTFVGYQENKCDWRKSKHVSKPINPPNLSISEFDFKTIDTRDFFKSDPLIQIIIVYSKDAKDKNDAALVIGFVTKSGVKKYYVVSEIYAKNYMVKMSSLRHIDESHLLDELCKENYTKNNVLTIKIDTKNSYHNVDVKNENVKPTEFQKYNHTVKSSDSRHVKSAVDCDSKCEFTGFKPEEYTKLGEVDVYFHESDSNQRVPLLVEFKPLSGQQLGGNGKDKKVQYQLKTIKKEEDDDKPKEWTKTYEKGLSETVDVSNILNGIYSGNLGKDLQVLINYIEENTEANDEVSECETNKPVSGSVTIKAVSGTFGSIGAIGTGVGGFFIYKNSTLVVTFFKSLF